jgi:3-hydroxyisobutyrate dehydrogenase-like beta-hydroxyacid dehydrogenase
MSALRLGFIGLGSMGQQMAARLLAAGHDVIVWNRSPGPVGELAKKGARAARSPAEAAAVGVLHTMLADDHALSSVLFDGGLFEAMRPGLVHVNHATISVAFARALAERHRQAGIGYVAAPVFGRPDAAEKGRLHVLAAGAPADVERVAPLLAAIGQRVWPLGDSPERANVVKVAGNFMIASAIETMAEASALARAHGVSAADFLEVMTGTLFGGVAFQGYGALIAARRYSPPGFRLRLGYKDVRLALAASDDANVPLPLGALLRDAFLDALAHGDADLDWSALAEVIARRAQLDRRNP